MEKQDVGVQVQGYVVSVWWYRGELFAPYGTQFYTFATREAAFDFALDKDRSLRSRYDFNWLNAGHHFWENHILVTITDPRGQTSYGWFLFTFSEEEVHQMCRERGYDLEVALVEREQKRQRVSFVFNARFEEENK